jgi:hypothetical protein
MPARNEGTPDAGCGAQVRARQIRADGRHAAILELKEARLLDAVAA